MRYNYAEYDSDVWQLSKYPVTYYRLLGIVLSYYAGSFNPKENIVQQYTRCHYTDSYIDWKISKVSRAISGLLLDLNQSNDLIIEEVLKEENLDKKYNKSFIRIFSENTCSYLKSVEYDDISDLFMPCFGVSNDIRLLGQLQRLEFICGAYISGYRGQDAEWVFSNNLEKFQLIYKYMIELGEEDDVVRSRSIFSTPHSHRINLNTDGNLWKSIKENLDK